jgi:hypothetical protein
VPKPIDIQVEEREPGKLPLGAIFMLPLFLMPMGGYFVQEKASEMGMCSLKMLIGIPCMTCGSTRATMRLLYGDVVNAFLFQPMMIAIYFVVGLWGVVSFGSFVMDKRVNIILDDRLSLGFKISLAVIPLVNWAYLIWVGI